MSKLDNYEIYDKENGNEVSLDVITSIQSEERKHYYNKLFHMYKNNPNIMTLKEVIDLRKMLLRNKCKEKVYLKYEGGFYMVAMDTGENLEKLSFPTNGFLHLLALHINKSGIAIYKNNKPIKSFSSLVKFLKVPEKMWRKIKKEIDEFDIMRKENLKDGIVLMLSPEYSGTSYEVTEYKFLIYSDYYKDKLSNIDYLYLVKKFEIDTSK